MSLEIEPRAANAILLKLSDFKGHKYILEIHTDGPKVHILRRDGKFKVFKDLYPDNIMVVETEKITIIGNKPYEQR